MLFSVQVEVLLHPGISDPQGNTIERALPALGFEGIENVRVGKSIRFDLDSPDQETAEQEVQDMCQRFLTNPVIEESRISMQVKQGLPA